MFFLIANLITSFLYPELKKPAAQFVPQGLLLEKYFLYTTAKLTKSGPLREKEHVALTLQEEKNQKHELDLTRKLRESGGHCVGLSILWSIDQLEGTRCFYTLSELLYNKEKIKDFDSLVLTEKQAIESTMQKIVAAQGDITQFKNSFELPYALYEDKFVVNLLNFRGLKEVNWWNETLGLEAAGISRQFRIIKKILEGDYKFNTVSQVRSILVDQKWLPFGVYSHGPEDVMWKNFKLKHPGIFQCDLEDILFVHCKDEIEKVLNDSTAEKVAVIGITELLLPVFRSICDKDNTKRAEKRGHAVSIAKSKSGIFSFFDCNKNIVGMDVNFHALAEQYLKPMFWSAYHKQATSYTLSEIFKENRPNKEYIDVDKE